MSAWTHKRVQFWDDERGIGNSLIVTLHSGWKFPTDPMNPSHVEGFDTVKEAKQAVRASLPCNCADCRKEPK
jgi:hypothetical protein